MIRSSPELVGLVLRELNHTSIGAAHAQRTAIRSIHRVGGGEAAHRVLCLHLIGLDPPGLEQFLAGGHHQWTGRLRQGLSLGLALEASQQPSPGDGESQQQSGLGRGGMGSHANA